MQGAPGGCPRPTRRATAELDSALAALLKELGHETCPARLVGRADAAPVVAVEILVEENQVAPVRVALEARVAAVGGPVAVAVTQEEPGETTREVGRHVPQRPWRARAPGAFDVEAVAVEQIEPLQG